MKQPSNTISSNTAPSHYLSSTPKPPTPHHHPFPVQLPLTGKSPTSTPATQATSQTFYDKAAFYPAHSTLPTILAFCSGRSHYPQPKPRPRRVCSHYPQHLATPQEHPLPHRYAPSVGRRHKIHLWRRRAGHDPAQRLPRSRLPPKRPMLGHPPRPCHCQRTGMVHQRHSTRPMTPPPPTSRQPPSPTFVSPNHTLNFVNSSKKQR